MVDEDADDAAKERVVAERVPFGLRGEDAQVAALVFVADRHHPALGVVERPRVLRAQQRLELSLSPPQGQFQYC